MQAEQDDLQKIIEQYRKREEDEQEFKK